MKAKLAKGSGPDFLCARCPLSSSCLLFLFTLAYATQSWPQTDAAPANTSSQEAHSRSMTRTTLPFQLCRDYLVVVEGSIGTLEKLTFIIDTGTYPSIVDQRIATALGLSERDGKVALVNQSVQAKLATLPFVRVGPARAESVPVLVQDLSSLKKTLGRRIDAIAGLDVLGKDSFTINYRTKQLQFGPVEQSRSAVSFETGPPLITVEARLHDRPVRLLVDTGAATTLLFQSRLKGPISPLAGKTTSGTNVSGGNFQLQPVLISDMRIGKEELGPQAGFVVADQKDEGQNFDGLLSMRGLHVEEISFDFENRRIGLKK
jgi:predicted aspartyl protease